MLSHVDYYTLRRSLTLILLHHLLIYSTEMDIGRGLERIECRVTQYSNSDESVMPVEQVLERVSVDMPRAFNFFRNPADVSGNTALNILVIYLALYIWANCWLLEWCKRSMIIMVVQGLWANKTVACVCRYMYLKESGISIKFTGPAKLLIGSVLLLWSMLLMLTCSHSDWIL